MNIRPASHSDFDAVLSLNEEFVRFLSPLSLERLSELHRHAALHLVVEHQGTVAAFLLAFRERALYDSVNFLWFVGRYDRFLYIDRVVVGQSLQGRGVGSMLYERAFHAAREEQVPFLTCEFDVDPPNPASERFHAQFGFREVGRHSVAGNKQVSLQVASVDQPRLSANGRRHV